MERDKGFTRLMCCVCCRHFTREARMHKAAALAFCGGVPHSPVCHGADDQGRGDDGKHQLEGCIHRQGDGGCQVGVGGRAHILPEAVGGRVADKTWVARIITKGQGEPGWWREMTGMAETQVGRSGFDSSQQGRQDVGPHQGTWRVSMAGCMMQPDTIHSRPTAQHKPGTPPTICK